jgi:hypothetical protein
MSSSLSRRRLHFLYCRSAREILGISVNGYLLMSPSCYLPFWTDTSFKCESISLQIHSATKSCGDYMYLEHLHQSVMTSPTTPPISSQPVRSRTSSDNSVRPPQLLHRSHTGRIERNRSTSSRLLSIRNQEAIWETATGLNWAPAEQHSSPEQSLPEFITPLSLSVTENSGATSSPSVTSAPEILRLSKEEEEAEEDEASFRAPATSTQEPEAFTPGLRCVRRVPGKFWKIPNELYSSMEFMMPPQYPPHYGSHASSYQSSEFSARLRLISKALTVFVGYGDHYSSAEQERAYAHTSPQPSSYAPSPYATSSTMVGSSAALSPRGGSTERETTSGHQYSSTVRSSYGTATSAAQPGYAYGSASQPALQYAPSSYPT